MKIMKRINPFGPIYGCFNGEGCNKIFAYYIGSNVTYEWVTRSTAKRLIETNGYSFDDFKKYYKAHHGSPKRYAKDHGPNPSFDWKYKAEGLYDFASTRSNPFAEYPYPRLDTENNLILKEK